MKNKIIKKVKIFTKYINKNKKIKFRLILFFVLIIIGVGLYYFKSIFIVAVVDGKPITRLSLIKQLEKESGKQTLENLITKNIIFKQAQQNNIQINKDDVDKEIENLKKSLESQGTTLDAALNLQGETMESLQENIRIQKTIEKLLENETKVSDEDLKKYFEENKSYYGKDAKYEDLKDDIEKQLKQNKLSQVFQEWMNKLRSESKIIYFVDYQ